MNSLKEQSSSGKPLPVLHDPKTTNFVLAPQSVFSLRCMHIDVRICIRMAF